MKFDVDSSVDPFDRMDFDRSIIISMMQVVGARGGVLISPEHRILKIIGEVIPASAIGHSVHDLLPEQFRDEHRGLVNSVTLDNPRMMAEGLEVEGEWEGEKFHLTISVAMLPTMPDKWKGSRFALVMGKPDE